MEAFKIEIPARGYIDSGVSVRSGWLTEKGENKLKELLGLKR